MKIFITGATGFIGKHLVPTLVCGGHHLTLALRDPQKSKESFPNCTIVKADFTKHHQASDWLPHIKGHDIVINLVGIISETNTQKFDDLHHKTPIALFTASQQARVTHIIQISALGADEGAQTPYHTSKKAADDFLLQRGTASLILRPSLLYGDEAKSWELFRALSALPVIGLVGGGKQCLQPLHIDDLVKAILLSIYAPPSKPTIINAVGRTSLTFANLLQQMRKQVTSSPALTFFLPVPLAKILAFLASRLGAKMINVDTIKMLQRGNCADVKPFVQHFGFSPRSLAFTPLSKARKHFARTYFLPSLLRLSIALTWIWTAAVSVFFYPLTDSLALLAKTGLTGKAALLALYGSAALDLLLGLAVLTAFRPRLTTLLQLSLIIGYSVILSLFIPELWLHPFGPLLKNLPIIAAIITLQAMETRHD